MDQKKTNSRRFEDVAMQLVDSRNRDGYWKGHLSSSALAVAVSIIAFYFYDPEKFKGEIRKGIQWLLQHVNQDGGFGDSPGNLSNVSTSLLSYAALHLTNDHSIDSGPAKEQLANYLKKCGIDPASPDIASHILRFYKKDYTFSVPILTTCALCGIPQSDGFKKIPQLPFELALLPAKFYRFLNLNVVSYAIPALVAVGIVIFKNKPSVFFIRVIRQWSISKALKILNKLLPESGGFLEAIPLTAFVSLSMIQSGYRNHMSVTKGIDFLKRTQRDDGSWPIDVDLSTWVTTLAVKSFREKLTFFLDQPSRTSITNHLLLTQTKSVHSFNKSDSGGWGWTNYSGSVPDGDDTPGAILALLFLNPKPTEQVLNAVTTGCDWLLKLQNRDGGFPTFSRGWGKLPFDQSCTDLTGHALLALASCIEKLNDFDNPIHNRRYKYHRAIVRATHYLLKEQHQNGAWYPLWFGNQYRYDQRNPVYGTARVIAYLEDIINPKSTFGKLIKPVEESLVRAKHFLVTLQNQDGSWGGDSKIAGSIEETSLAVSALTNSQEYHQHVQHGLSWLEKHDFPLPSAPIGLYFASLWYDEALYPMIFYNEALAKTVNK